MEILLVESNLGEAFIIQDILEQLKLDCHLAHMKSGVECLEWIKKAELTQDIRMPDLIITENKLDGILNGLELIQALKLKECLLQTAIVMLTSFHDIYENNKQVQELGLDGYFTKPEFDSYEQVLLKIIGIARNKMGVKN